MCNHLFQWIVFYLGDGFWATVLRSFAAHNSAVWSTAIPGPLDRTPSWNPRIATEHIEWIKVPDNFEGNTIDFVASDIRNVEMKEGFIMCSIKSFRWLSEIQMNFMFHLENTNSWAKSNKLITNKFQMWRLSKIQQRNSRM